MAYANEMILLLQIVMMPSKRVANISNVITHKTVQIAAQHINESDDGDMDGTHLETIDQMDGAFDGELSDSDDTMSMTNQSFTKNKSLVNVPIKRSQIMKFNRNIKKTIPRYVKMGLFGGSPPDDEETGTEANAEAVETTDVIEQSGDDIKMEETADETSQNENDEQQLDDQSAEEQNAEPATDADGTESHEISGSGDDAQQDAASADTTATNETTTILTVEEPQLKLEPRSTTEPTASDTEAANILTTIKSGEMLRNNDLKTENILITPTTTGIMKVSSPSDDVVKILFNNEPALINTTKNGSAKSSQKTSNSFIASNTGHLDALASAALQASSGNYYYILLFLITNKLFVIKLLHLIFRR